MSGKKDNNISLLNSMVYALEREKELLKYLEEHPYPTPPTIYTDFLGRERIKK